MQALLDLQKQKGADASETYLLGLVKAQTMFLRRFQKQALVLSYPQWPELLGLLDRDVASPSSRLLATQGFYLTLKLCSLKRSENLSAAFEAGMVSLIGKLLQRVGPNPQSPHTKLLNHITRLLQRLSDLEQAIPVMAQHPSLVLNLVLLLRPHNPPLSSDLSGIPLILAPDKLWLRPRDSI